MPVYISLMRKARDFFCREKEQHRYDKTTFYMYDNEKSFASLIKLKTVNI